MRSISFALFTWYGISVTMMAWRSLPRPSGSTSVLARTMTVPRPVA